MPTHNMMTRTATKVHRMARMPSTRELVALQLSGMWLADHSEKATQPMPSSHFIPSRYRIGVAAHRAEGVKGVPFPEQEGVG